MAIVKQSVPYEYLVRLNADGTVRGQHIKYLERIYDEETGEVHAEKEGDALPVGDERSTVLLETAIGQIAAGLAKAEETERQKRQAVEAERDEAKAKRQEAEQVAEELGRVLDEERQKASQAKREAEQAIIAERAEKAKLAEKLERSNAERNQLLQQPPRQNDTGNAGRGE